MKKIISCILVLVIVTALFVPMSVSAASSTAWTNTSELFANDSNTDLGAYRTSNAPAIDGDKGTEWNGAQPLVINNYTTMVIAKSGAAFGTDAKLSMMYDNTNLYLLIELNGGSLADISIVPARDVTPYASGETPESRLAAAQKDVEGIINKFDGYMFNFAASEGTGNDLSATIKARRWVYKDHDFTETNGQKEAWGQAVEVNGTSYSTITGLQGKYSSTSSGKYVMEAVIPWKYLDCSGPTAFGILVNTSGNGRHITTGGNAPFWGKKMNFDHIYADPVELRTQASAPPAYIAEALKVKNAYNALVADFSASKTVFEIGTKYELIALSLYDRINNNSAYTKIYDGKTFKLTADIDLNPGVDWSTYTHDGAQRGEYTGVLPTVTWKGIGSKGKNYSFGGIFDGQGHTISGLWNNSGSFAHEKVYSSAFISCLYNKTGECGVRDLIIDNGYLTAASTADNSGHEYNAAVIGCMRSAGSFMENVYVGSNFTYNAQNLTSTSHYVGTLAGKPAALGTEGFASDNIIIENCVFAGKYILNASGNWRNLLIGGTWCDSVIECYINDCAFIGEAYYGTQKITDLAGVGIYRDGNNATSATARLYASATETSADPLYCATVNGKAMPVAVADMVANETYCQRNNNNSTAVRIVNEINSFAWDSFGYKIDFVRSDGATAQKDDTANVNVYSTVTAAGVKKTPTSKEFSALDGVALYAVEISGIDAGYIYTIEITPVWTKGDVEISGMTRTVSLPEESIPLDDVASQKVIYKKVGDINISMNIYQPTTKKYEKAPVLILFPGGGWRAAGIESFAGYDNEAGYLRSEGWVVAVAEYRLRGDSGNESYRHLASSCGLYGMISDCMDSVRYLVKYADTLGIDVKSICTGGHSAGGFMALMTAFGDQSDFKVDSKLGKYSFDIAVATAKAGPTDSTADAMLSSYIPRIFPNGNTQADLEKCSPITYVSADMCPVIIGYGTNDEIFTAENHWGAFEDKCESEGVVKYQMVEVVGGNHSIQNNTAVVSAFKDFLMKYVNSLDPVNESNMSSYDVSDILNN